MMNMKTISEGRMTEAEEEMSMRLRLAEVLVNKLFNMEMEIKGTSRVLSFEEEVSLLASMLIVRLQYTGLSTEEAASHFAEGYRLMEAERQAHTQATHPPARGVQ